MTPPTPAAWRSDALLSWCVRTTVRISPSLSLHTAPTAVVNASWMKRSLARTGKDESPKKTPKPEAANVDITDHRLHGTEQDVSFPIPERQQLEVARIAGTGCQQQTSTLILDRSPMSVPDWILAAVRSCFVDYAGPEDDALLPSSSLSRPAVSRWEFTCLDCQSIEELVAVVMDMFERLLEALDISRPLFARFVRTIFANYPPNPYHNAYHAVDVLQCIHYFVSTGESSVHLASILAPLHQFALYVAALCHDLGHPAFSNAFLQDTNHPLRILYNDTSVLEQYHSTILFSILASEPFRPLFEHWSLADRTLFRKVVLRSILATDMANHFQLLHTFDSSVPKNLPSEIDESIVIQYCIALIKSADICNLVRPFPLAERWAMLLMDEFWHQVRREIPCPVGRLRARRSLCQDQPARRPQCKHLCWPGLFCQPHGQAALLCPRRARSRHRFYARAAGPKLGTLACTQQRINHCLSFYFPSMRVCATWSPSYSPSSASCRQHWTG